MLRAKRNESAVEPGDAVPIEADELAGTTPRYRFGVSQGPRRLEVDSHEFEVAWQLDYQRREPRGCIDDYQRALSLRHAVQDSKGVGTPMKGSS